MIFLKNMFFYSGRCFLEKVCMDATDFVEYFAQKVFDLGPHAYVAEQQSAFLKHTKDTLRRNEFDIISDFAENYSFVMQDEIQAYHWMNQQCTIHPFSIYYKDEHNTLQTISFVVIAESLEHNHISVYLFQTKLIQFLRNKFAFIDKIYFFSDGAAGQYKNKMNFYNLCQIKAKFGFDAEWHFFATYHGKSPCDAIGGTVKRMATRESLRRRFRDHIQTAKDLYNFLREKETKIHFELCTTEQHRTMEWESQAAYLNVKTIAGTQKHHCFIPVSSNTIMIKRTSFAAQPKTVTFA